MNGRQTMGPRASEPEQRTYVVERVRADGHVTDRVLVRHVHALEAARAFAEDSGIPKPWHEYAHAPGVWSLSNANTVVRATLDTPHARASLTAAPLTFMRSSPARGIPESTVHEFSKGPTDDERAATQRRIADAIRWVKNEPRDAVAECLLRDDPVAVASRPFRNTGSDEDLAVLAARHMLAALAACARYPEILDAVRQVAQVHALEIREDYPSEGG